MTLEKFLEFNYLGKLDVSPNRQSAAFVTSVANHEENAYEQTLYLYENRKVSRLKKIGKNNDFKFLSDFELIINMQKNKKERTELKEKQRQSYYRFHLLERTLEKAFTLPFPASIEEVIDDDTLLLSANLTEDAHILYEGTKKQREDYLKKQKKENAFETIDELPYYFNGRGFKTGEASQRFIYKVESGDITPLFSKNFTVGSTTLSKDKKTLFYTGNPREDVMGFTSRVFKVDLETLEHTVLYDKLDYSISKIIEFDNTLVLAAKDMQKYGLNENPDFYTLKDNTLEVLAKHGQAMGNTVGTDARFLPSPSSFIKDNAFYFVTTIDDHNELYKLSEDGKLGSVYEMDGAIDGVMNMKDDIVMIGMEGQDLQELYSLNLKTVQKLRLTTFNTEMFKDHYISKPEVVTIEKEGVEIKGFVLLPKDYTPGSKVPAIMDIHGGPKTVYGQIYYHEMQYWVNEGYAVFFANPRGSDGKGNAFADIRGKYGTIDYEDLMDFTDEVLENYSGIDADRLFVTGGSYGGFMTNWIVGHTDRFKAAATQRSISNWISFYGTSDIGYYFASDQTDGHPIDDMEKLYEQSPIKYARNIKTPLLFIHSDKDYRCPMEQAQQLYAVVKTQNVHSRLVWIKEETHELSRSGKPQARVKRLKEMTEWFKHYT
ncbi:MAG: alpha/beta hydrolase family protein [Bacillota bacterium]